MDFCCGLKGHYLDYLRLGHTVCMFYVKEKRKNRNQFIDDTETNKLEAKLESYRNNLTQPQTRRATTLCFAFIKEMAGLTYSVHIYLNKGKL